MAVVTWVQRSTELLHLKGTADDHDQQSHGGGRARTPEIDRLVREMADWETTKPWNLTKDQATAQTVPGFWHKSARGSETASWDGRYIRTTDDFYALPEETRRAVAYHEAGHAMLEAAGGLTDTDLDLIDKPGGTALGYNAEEILSEAYSALWSDPDWFDRMGATEIRQRVLEVAEAAGFPLPDRDHEFHLKGTQYDHDQSTHGGGGGGRTVRPQGTRGMTHDEVTVTEGWKPATRANRYAEVQSDRPVFVDDTYGEAVFAVQAADGAMIELKYNVTGARYADPALRQRAVNMLNGVADAYDMAPLGNGAIPQVLVVSDVRIGAPAAVDPNGTYYAPNNILLNDIGDAHFGRAMWEELENPSPENAKYLETFMMPASREVDSIPRYVGAHEYGHVRAAYNIDDQATIGQVRPMTLGQNRDDRTEGVWQYMSAYARTNAVEAHAEAFAEWVVSGGETTNRFARAYADIFGWGKEREERALAASGGEVPLPDWDDIVFICDSPLDGPSYVTRTGTLSGQVEFHLQGTVHDHDQSTHAGGRRIAPVSGATKLKSVDADLTMDSLPADIQAKVRKQFADSLHVTTDEAEAHLVDLAESALVKGLPGRPWYQEAHDEVAAAADRHGIDPDVAIAMTAALSPGTPWDENLRNAKAIMEAAADLDAPLDAEHIRNTNVWANRPDGSTGERNSAERARPDDTFNTLYARDPKLAAVYLAKKIGASVGYSYDNFFKATDLMVANDPARIDGVLNGAKVRSFYNNLARPAAADNDVTVDVHMQRAMANNTASTTAQEKHTRATSIQKRSSSITGSPSYNGAQVGAMPLMADVIRAATVEFNARYNLDLTPHEFQAVVWVEQIAQYPPSVMTRILKGRDL